MSKKAKRNKTITGDGRSVSKSFLERGSTVTVDRYCKIFTRLREAITRKRPGLLTEGITFLRGNLGHHFPLWQRATSYSPEDHQQFGWDIIDHPPSSPDVAPRDFHLFPRLKEHLGGRRRFASDEQVKHFSTTSLNTQGQYYYQEGIFKLVPRSDKCLNRWLYWLYEKKSAHFTVGFVTLVSDPSS